MKTAQCSACGAEARIETGRYPFTESGLRNVVLDGIDLIKCEECGNVDPIIPRVNELMRVLAAAVVAKPSKLEGEEARFLRKYLRMTGEEFSALIHVDKTTLSKWENNELPIGDQSDRLIRAVVLALGDGLKEKMEEVVRSFTRISDKRQGKKKERISINPATMSYAYA